MTLDLEQFKMGVLDQLDEKRATVIESTLNENILPFISGQRKWNYGIYPEGLRLHDGERVFGFSLPDPTLSEMVEVAKLEDIPLQDFDKNKLSGGTAQVHRASPDSIYLTLADGRVNPTFTLEHHSNRNWKYLPSKKLIARKKALEEAAAAQAAPPTQIAGVNPEALLDAARAHVKQAGDALSMNLDLDQANELLQKGLNFGKGLIDFKATHPLLLTLGGMYGAKKMSEMRQAASPAYAQMLAISPGKRFNREIGIPLLSGLGLTGAATLLKN
jgi:hypothetical protein